MLLQASELTVKYGERIILDHEKLFIEPKQKIGVVGLNGNGKSTLLKIIASLDHASDLAFSTWAAGTGSHAGALSECRSLSDAKHPDALKSP